MTTAVIYARVSTVRQAEEELPVESQIDRCREKALALGATVDRVFRDDGISGATDARPAFRDCIAYCELTQPKYLITWGTSRFARNKVDAGLYKMRLERAGVDLVYVSQTFDRKSDAGWVTESVMELFDEFYSRQVSADTTRSMMKNARDGYWNGGRVVYGYRPVPAADNPKRKRLEIDPAEAATVREIFQLRLQGYGASAIAEILRDRGDSNRGQAWNKTSVINLLRNPAVVGCVVFGRKDRKVGQNRPRDRWVIVPSHEPIISQDQWDQVQELMDAATPQRDAGSPHSSYLFTGILRCPDGSSMQVESAKGRSRRYYYYNCMNAQKYVGEARRIPAREFDEWLVEQILDRILTPENLREVAHDLRQATSTWERDRLTRLQQVQAAISKWQQRNSNIYELFELHGKHAPNLGDLTDRLRQNKRKIGDLERQLVEINAEQRPQIDVSDQDVTELSASLRYIIRTSEDPKKVRAFFRSFIRDIWVDRSEVRIEYRPEVLVINREPLPVPGRLSWLPRLDSNQRPTD